MKKILVIICGMLLAHKFIGRDNFVLINHQDPVGVYPSAFATRPSRIIQQWTETETLYSFQVVDDSLFRFKVRIFEPDRLGQIDTIYSSLGWIDKINATVFMRATEQEDGRVYIKLYDEPDKSSRSIKLAENDYRDFSVYVDKIQNDWYHINFEYNDSLYSGWTPVYCSNPYGCN